MKKTILAVCLLSFCLLFTACGNTEEELTTTVTENTTTVIEETTAIEETTSTTEESTPGTEENLSTDETLNEAYAAVKEAYGENYYPNFPVEEAYLTEMMGIAAEDIETFVGETSMISVNVDTFIGIKAVEGKGDAVKEAVLAFQESQISDSMQYPMNIARIANSVVYANGDYVFYFILGPLYDVEEPDEEEEAKFYQEQGVIGTEALDKVFAE